MVQWGLAHGHLIGTKDPTQDAKGNYLPKYILSPNGKNLRLDDLAYLFAHIDAIVASVGKK
jgi:hypothetical protein